METLTGTSTEELIQQASHRTDRVTDFFAQYGPRILIALVLLVLGRWIIKLLNRLIDRSLRKAKVDTALRNFLESLFSIVLKIGLIIAIAGFLGFKSTSLVAILGAAGLAVGLALQSSLSNLASGIMILLFKPYTIGDFVSIQGQKGTVTGINIFNTELISPEHKTIIVPNSVITADTIVNFDKIGNIRVDVSVGISYDADIHQAKKVLQTVLEANSTVLDVPAPGVYVSELADSSVNFIVRGYARPGDYRDAYFSLTEEVKLALDRESIEIPFPQRVIHTPG